MKYEVRLGHLAAVVVARDPREAVSKARQRFCEQFPRLWDVIQQADEGRFEITPLPRGASPSEPRQAGTA